MFSRDFCRQRWNQIFSAPALFVVGVWIVMLAGSLAFLARYAVNVPFAEDNTLIPYVTGAKPVDMGFLWYQCNDAHIIPLPKLVMYGCLWLTYDFRTTMYVSVLGCAVLALALTLAARSLRGHFDYSDAFFALGLLHLGHWESFLIGFAIQEVMSTGLLVVILLVILHSTVPLRRGQALLAGLCLLILPTTGMAGFLLVPPFSVWLAYSTWISWRSRDVPPYSVALQLALLFASFVSLLPYLFSLPRGMIWYHGPAGLADKAYAMFSVLMQLLTLGFGSSAASPWLPILEGERAFYLVGSVVLALIVLAHILLLVRRHPPTERLRRAGLCLYFLANLLVLAGIAFGRSGVSRSIGLSSRYSLYSVTLLWGIYFTWQLYGARFGSRLVPVGLFAFMCAMLSLNMYQGCGNGQARFDSLKPLERDYFLSEAPTSDTASERVRCTGNHGLDAKDEAKTGESERLNGEEIAKRGNGLPQRGVRERPYLNPAP